MTNYRGKFLAAVPNLTDPNFFRSVVLMFQHDSDGASGLVINRPLPIQMQEVWEEIHSGQAEIEVEGALHLGGPVKGPLMCVHRQAQLAELEIIDGVYLSMKREHLQEIATNTAGKNDRRFFSGYSGWGADQLAREVQEGGWLIQPARAALIFSPAVDKLWREVCDEFGGEIMLDPLARKHKPDNSQLN